MCYNSISAMCYPGTKEWECNSLSVFMVTVEHEKLLNIYVSLDAT